MHQNSKAGKALRYDSISEGTRNRYDSVSNGAGVMSASIGKKRQDNKLESEVPIKKIPNYASYLERWELVRDFLEKPP